MLEDFQSALKEEVAEHSLELDTRLNQVQSNIQLSMQADLIETQQSITQTLYVTTMPRNSLVNFPYSTQH